MIGRSRSCTDGSRTTSPSTACRFIPLSWRFSTSSLAIALSFPVSCRSASMQERQRSYTRSQLASFETGANRNVSVIAHRRSAFWPPSGWAFFVPAEAYSVILMPTAWGVFVFWFLVWEMVKTERAPTPLRSLAYGTLIGITATGIATILFIVPLLLAALLLKPQSEKPKRSPWVARGTAVALLFLGLGAGTSPCWIHNYFVARDPVFLSAHSGINFWLGNNPDATGYPRFPGLHAGQAAMLKDSIDLAETAAGRSLKRSEVSDYWSAKARDYIGGNFGGWLRLMGRKLVNFWNAFEYDDISIIDKLRGSGVILPGLHFGLVAALAIPGVCFSIRQFPTARWIAAAILLHLAAVLPVFVTERYRLWRRRDCFCLPLRASGCFGKAALWRASKSSPVTSRSWRQQWSRDVAAARPGTLGAQVLQLRIASPRSSAMGACPRATGTRARLCAR